MDITVLSLQIILLFLPGIVLLTIVRSLIYTEKIEKFTFSLYTLVLGFVLYLLYGLLLRIISICAEVETKVYFFESLTTGKIKADFGELLSVTIIAVVMGIISSIIINKGIYLKMARYLNLTTKASFIDVWCDIYTLNDNIGYVTVRDYKYKLIYRGWIQYYSNDSKEIKELFLRDVQVFNDESKFCYNTPGLYFSRKHNEFSIEFFDLSFTDPKLSPNNEEMK